MRFIRLPQVQNVGPSRRVTLRLPLGQVYEKLYFHLQGNIVASLISDIVLKLNNKELQKWATMADFQAFCGYRGNVVNTGYFVIDFTERLAKEEVGMKMGAIAATAEAGVQDFTVEFSLGAYTESPASRIEAWADVDNPSANSLVQRVQYMQKTIAAQAEEQIYIPYGANGFQLKRILIRHTALDSIKVRRDGVDVYEGPAAALANIRQQDFGRVPQAGYHILDFMPDSLQSNAFNTKAVIGADGLKLVENLDIRVKTTGQDTLHIYTESYDLSSRL